MHSIIWSHMLAMSIFKIELKLSLNPLDKVKEGQSLG